MPSLSVPLDLRQNENQLDPYLSLDARIAYTQMFHDSELSVFLEVTNLLNRNNVGAVEAEIEPDNGGYSIALEEEHLIPLAPSLGIQWRF